MEQEALWRKFESTLDATPIETWEFLAPRSRRESRRSEVYKLFLRPKGRGQWWFFKDGISRVPATYTDAYEAPSISVFRGTSNLLEFLQAEAMNPGDRAALARVFDILHSRLRAAPLMT